MDVKEKNVYMRVYVCYTHRHIHPYRQERTKVIGKRIIFLLMVLEKLVSYLEKIYVAPVHKTKFVYMYLCDI